MYKLYMNCFNNGRPKLSSGDRTRDLRARTIYASTVSEFKGKGGCRSYDGKVGIYKRSAKIRNVGSHSTLLALSRGHALCVDGLKSPAEEGSVEMGLAKCPQPPTTLQGVCSGPRSRQVKISMGWNYYNIINIADVDALCSSGLPVVNSEDAVGALEVNEVDSIVNADGSGVVIDPSNVLFGDNEDCRNPLDVNKYLRYASVYQVVKIVGVPISSFGVILPCGDALLAGLVGGTAVSGTVPPLLPALPPPPVVAVSGGGIITRVCCSGGVLTLYVSILAGSFLNQIVSIAPPGPATVPPTATVYIVAPTEVTTIQGNPCAQANLSWGNETQQNYMASFNYPDSYLSLAS